MEGDFFAVDELLGEDPDHAELTEELDDVQLVVQFILGLAVQPLQFGSVFPRPARPLLLAPRIVKPVINEQ